MDIDPDNGDSSHGGDYGHGAFRAGAGRKRKIRSSSIDIMANARRQRAARREETDKLIKWINDIKWSHQGVPSTRRDDATALLVIFNLLLEDVNLTQTEAITIASRYLGRSASVLGALVAHWHKYREIYVDSGTRGGSQGQQSLELFVSLPHFIISTIMDRHAEGKTTTVKDIQQAIVNTHQQYIGYWPIYYLMHDKMKLSYGLLKDSVKLTEDANRIKRIGQFLVKYAAALNLEKNKEAIVCYMDESYVNTGHHIHYGWYVDSTNKNILTGTGVGKRLIIVHAITSDGLLRHFDVLTNKTISAELIYEAKNPSGDFHSNMDGYNFRLWVKQYLFPAFEAKYGHQKRMILILNNAPYHKEQGEHYINVKSMSKIDMINLLLSKKVHNIVIIRDGQAKKFKANEWHLNGPAGPYKEELQAFIDSWIKHYPDLQKTLLEKLFEQKSLAAKVDVPDFHYVILTPPYSPQLQPIELVWSYVKRYVAKQFTSSRTVQQLIEQTKKGFYGDGGDHEGISTEMVRNMIEHAHKYCNMLINDDP
ncbi:unnamed protein product [Rotaria sordida]|uniref:Tc1-like transposase DDE domain-containing protein n=1 Tax=Rotaria sordida TaxID=392033 RepID=A0A819ZYA9_9BILA|nr:unnamed protein product [Rotaria sordida]CAF4226481.1 unnamed protein product [Rotaria sordida]